MKIKRFVTEYANYRKSDIKNNNLMQKAFKDESINRIDQALKLNKRGLITSNETIKIILEA